jgi:hypothetical protein
MTDAASLERDLNSHAAEGWRVVSTFQAISAGLTGLMTDV